MCNRSAFRSRRAGQAVLPRAIKKEVERAVRLLKDQTASWHRPSASTADRGRQEEIGSGGTNGSREGSIIHRSHTKANRIAEGRVVTTGEAVGGEDVRRLKYMFQLVRFSALASVLGARALAGPVVPAV
ncbi:hypothetical protein B0H14DRAFT_2594806 [Mycena olivaceomarginata]|nr:hypothetical protein B0H14DRAFT_2594806 [Mycena olivaceomarginata]